MRLDFSRVDFRVHPYVIGLAPQVFDPDAYARCVRAYPDESLFARMTGGYEKFSLSERNHPTDYHAVVHHEPWRGLHRYIKSADFINDVGTCLATVGVSLDGVFRSRFEFSSLPAAGGMLKPHTDIPSKVVTLILPMMAPGAWNPAWGGSTDVLVPSPGVVAKDYETPLEAFDIVARYPCDPNQAVVFLKWDNSWHAVGPIQGPPGHWRRTLTVNIERVPA